MEAFIVAWCTQSEIEIQGCLVEKGQNKTQVPVSQTVCRLIISVHTSSVLCASDPVAARVNVKTLLTERIQINYN